MSNDKYRITKDGNGKFYVEAKCHYFENSDGYKQVNIEPFNTLEEAKRFLRSLERTVVTLE